MADSDLIQIVDENDRPVGVATRGEAQQKGLLHRIARIVVYDENGNVLLQKRSSSRPTWPNCWDNSAAGHVDVGEDYITAARRELKEELGVDGKPEEIAYYKAEGELDGRKFNRFTTVFKVVLSSDTHFTPQEDEVSGLRWFSVDELNELVKSSPNEVTYGVKDTLKYISHP
jgi:isopentenyl-diphosphate delta-isomerase type 1